MCEHLDPEDGQARPSLDASLGVATWPRSRVPVRRPALPVPADAPAWWHGDEEASQGFLRAAGVRLG